MDTLGAMSQGMGMFQGFSEAGQLWTQSTELKANAGLLDVQAQGEIASGKLQADAYRRKGDQFIGRQRAMYAKAGVSFTGSPAQIWAETERNIQLDVLNISLNATARANEIGFEALQARIAAGRARTAAIAKATGTILNMTMMSAAAGGGGSNVNQAGSTKGVTSVTSRGNTTYLNTTVK